MVDMTGFVSAEEDVEEYLNSERTLTGVTRSLRVTQYQNH